MAMALDGHYLVEIPGAKVLNLSINMFQPLKETQIFKGKHKQLNEIKSIEDMKMDFNKENETLKKTQPEMMMKMKNRIYQVKAKWKASSVV